MNEMTAEEAAEIIMNPSGYGTHERNMAECIASSTLRRVASGELAEVVHAHWIGGYSCKNGQWNYTPPECSNCHNTVTNGETPYCPFCDALMGEPDMEILQDGKDDSHA